MRVFYWVGGIFILSLLGAFYYDINLIVISVLCGGALFLYYEFTLSPEEKKRRRIKREREARRREELKWEEDKARARAKGKARGHYEAKDNREFRNQIRKNIEHTRRNMYKPSGYLDSSSYSPKRKSKKKRR